jgi:hypothetical protein
VYTAEVYPYTSLFAILYIQLQKLDYAIELNFAIKMHVKSPLSSDWLQR